MRPVTNDNRRLPNPNPNPERVLSIPVKKTDPVDLYRPLRNLVATKYSESDAQKVESVLETLNKCRIDMVERVDLSPPMQRDCLIHYFKCICMVQPLFTAISSDAANADSDPITFVWYDALKPDIYSSQRSIQLEKASILFNLGAICSLIGASCDRTTAVGRHLAIDAFKDAAKFFWKLWKVYAMDVSATFDLTLVAAQTLYQLFSTQALELKLQQQLDRTYIDSTLQQHRCALLFKEVSKHYRRALNLLLHDSAITKYVVDFDEGWITHLHQKIKFFRVEARKRRSSILPKSKRPKTFKAVLLPPLEKFLRGMCMCMCDDQLIPKQKTLFLDLMLSEYSPFRIMDGGKLVAMPWDKSPPYPSSVSMLSPSSPSQMLEVPLKKSEHLDLYDSLRNYFVLKYSESEAESVEGFLKIIDKLRREIMQCDNLSLHIRRDRLIQYFKYLCMIQSFFPMTTTLPNPPIFIWYDAFHPQQSSSRHNIHLEKASVLFNLGAICTQIARSCDLATIQGYQVAMDALNDASHWFKVLPPVAQKASATMDLSEKCIQILCEIISAQIVELKMNPHSHSDGSSSAGYPVSSLLYQKAYDMSTLEPLAENLRRSSIPEFLESKMKTSHVQTAPSDVIEQFLSGYCEAQSLLREGCQTPCLDFLSEFGLLKITDGNIVANFRGSNVRIGGDRTHQRPP